MVADFELSKLPPPPASGEVMIEKRGESVLMHIGPAPRSLISLACSILGSGAVGIAGCFFGQMAVTFDEELGGSDLRWLMYAHGGIAMLLFIFALVWLLLVVLPSMLRVKFEVTDSSVVVQRISSAGWKFHSQEIIAIRLIRNGKEYRNPKHARFMEIQTPIGYARPFEEWTGGALEYVAQALAALLQKSLIEVSALDVKTDPTPCAGRVVFDFGLWKFVTGLVAVPTALTFLALCIMVPYAIRSVDWPSTQGIVTISQFHERTEKRKPWTDFAYSYTVDGKQYSSDRVRLGGDPAQPTKRSIRWQASNPAGSRKTVYYDPSAPTESVLEPGVNMQHWLLFVIAAMLSGLLIWVISAKPTAAARAMEPAIAELVRRYTVNFAAEQAKLRQRTTPKPIGYCVAWMGVGICWLLIGMVTIAWLKTPSGFELENTNAPRLLKTFPWVLLAGFLFPFYIPFAVWRDKRRRARDAACGKSGAK